MHPCPIPDAAAHGKDGNNGPEQLSLSNGEMGSVLGQTFSSSGLYNVVHVLCPHHHLFTSCNHMLSEGLAVTGKTRDKVSKQKCANSFGIIL